MSNDYHLAQVNIARLHHPLDDEAADGSDSNEDDEQLCRHHATSANIAASIARRILACAVSLMRCTRFLVYVMQRNAVSSSATRCSLTRPISTLTTA